MELLLLKIIILAASIYLVGKLTKLFLIDDFITALISAVLLALVNALVKPLLIILTLPITIVTLGIFLLFVNGICLQIVSALLPRFRTTGCLTSAIAALLISLVNVLLEWLLL